eukprot:TRINITY_DN11249_c0_g1_i1.p2 TRINITY_DN11249_c0_g1~~TRINITY_DN11249_c0_g1_i1.p2  ORF type:complete len:62 (+),score=2.90 TRINITY_DN11249_c0_g1_i1:76-261(+)
MRSGSVTGRYRNAKHSRILEIRLSNAALCGKTSEFIRISIRRQQSYLLGQAQTSRTCRSGN